MAVENIHTLVTEQQNPRTQHIDTVSSLEMMQMIQEENKRVAPAIDRILEALAEAVDAVAQRIRLGGRLLYAGAGTSGRIGVLDASEIGCTYGMPAGTVTALVAGGYGGLTDASVGDEDDYDSGMQDAMDLKLTAQDVIAGIAASGRTPYVLGAMEAVRQTGGMVLSVTCNPGSPMDEKADIQLSASVGPEVITGSTRMKAGSYQKMVLNMLSTGAMVRLGRVYGNDMVYGVANNYKGHERMKRLLRKITGCSVEESEQLYEQANCCVADAVKLHERLRTALAANGDSTIGGDINGNDLL